MNESLVTNEYLLSKRRRTFLTYLVGSKGLMVVCLIALIPIGFAILSWMNASLFIPEKLHDFGWVAGGTEVFQTFQIENRSIFDSIEILRIEKTCGCTNASVSTFSLKPHTQALLTVVVSTSTQQSAFGTSITIIWRATGTSFERRSSIVLTGHVVQMLSVEPKNYQLHDVNIASDVQRVEFSVRKNSRINSPKWDNLGVSTNTAGVRLKLFKSTSENWRLVAEFNPQEQPLGQLKALITLHCFLGARTYPTSYNVLLSAKIFSDVEAKPTSFYLGSIQQNASIVQTLVLSSPLHDIKMVSSLYTDSQFVNTKWDYDHEGNVLITAKFTPGDHKEQKTGCITLTFYENNSLRRMIIPYMAYVTSASSR